MMEPISLKHEFVEFIPDDLKERTIYVSIRFATATHLCCCGCGEKVVTPLRPTDWKLIFDGKTISLDPSIGNWSFACRSHYWVSNNKIRWASQWSREEIDAGRAHDRWAKARYFGNGEAGYGAAGQKQKPEKLAQPEKGILRKLKKLWSR
jgi:Family of unknown function (DUF6527)